MGKVLLGNIRGPQGETGGPYNTLSSFYGTLDPTGAAASDLAIANWIEDCGSNGNPGFAPPGTYKITSQMNWQIPGLQIVGSGGPGPSPAGYFEHWSSCRCRPGAGYFRSGLRLQFPGSRS